MLKISCSIFVNGTCCVERWFDVCIIDKTANKSNHQVQYFDVKLKQKVHVLFNCFLIYQRIWFGRNCNALTKIDRHYVLLNV